MLPLHMGNGVKRRGIIRLCDSRTAHEKGDNFLVNTGTVTDTVTTTVTVAVAVTVTVTVTDSHSHNRSKRKRRAMVGL